MALFYRVARCALGRGWLGRLDLSEMDDGGGRGVADGGFVIVESGLDVGDNGGIVAERECVKGCGADDPAFVRSCVNEAALLLGSESLTRTRAAAARTGEESSLASDLIAV